MASIPRFRVVEDGEHWLVDVRGVLPNGKAFRRRVKAKVTSKRQAENYGAAVWQAALNNEIETRRPRPLFEKLWATFWEQHVLGSRLKPSQQTSLTSLWRAHLKPAFGATRVCDIDYEAVQAFKGERAHLSPKTVNNALIALKTALRFAVDRGLIDKQPKISMLKQQRHRPTIYDIPTYNQLVMAALELSRDHAAVVLLGGECGLRAGEMLALEHGDVVGDALIIQRSKWKKHVGTTKGYSARTVPMTERTADVIHALARRRGALIRQTNGQPATYKVLRRLLLEAQKRSETPKLALHALRHTFATDITKLLGIRAAQGLLGHAEVTTTERYTHLVADEQVARALEIGRGIARALPAAGPQHSESKKDS